MVLLKLNFPECYAVSTGTQTLCYAVSTGTQTFTYRTTDRNPLTFGYFTLPSKREFGYCLPIDKAVTSQ